MTDVVIDTNVLAHTQNPECDYFQDSVDLVTSLIPSDKCLCVDEGFDMIEANNKSLICHEYLKHLVHGSLGYQLVVLAATNNRIVQVRRRANQTISKKVNKLLSNKQDRTFVNVAYNSENKYLVSHDYDDFAEDKRKVFNKDMAVLILSAKEYIDLPF